MESWNGGAGGGRGKLTPAGRLSVAVGYTTALGMHLRLWWARLIPA